jgi:sulfonate transport system permease protein
MTLPSTVVRRSRTGGGRDRPAVVDPDLPAIVVAAPAYDHQAGYELTGHGPGDIDDRDLDEPDDDAYWYDGADGRSTTARAIRRGGRLLRRSVGLIALVLFWQWVSTRHWWHGNIPSPHQVWDAMVQLERGGQLWPNISASLGRVGKGLLIGGSLGLIAGVLSGLFRLGEDVIDAPFQVLRMLPSLALAPLFVIWFGIGDSAKINLIAVGVFAPMYLNTYHGIRAIDSRHVEAATSFGLRRPALIAHVIIPGALPQILVGVRQALGVAWFTLVVAEQIRNDRGLGSLMTDAQQYFRTDVMFVVLAIYGVLGLLTDVFVRLLERKALAWRRSFVGA